MANHLRFAYLGKLCRFALKYREGISSVSEILIDDIWTPGRPGEDFSKISLMLTLPFQCALKLGRKNINLFFGSFFREGQ